MALPQLYGFGEPDTDPVDPTLFTQVGPGTMRCFSNTGYAGGGVSAYAYDKVNTYNADQSSQYDVINNNTDYYWLLRASGTDPTQTGYFIKLFSSFGIWRLYSIVSGSLTQIGADQTTSVLSSSDQVLATVTTSGGDAVVSVYINSVLAWSITDSPASIASGAPGYGEDGLGAIDNWVGNNVGGATGGGPLIDNGELVSGGALVKGRLVN